MTWLFIVLFFVVCILILIFVPQLLIKRAFRQVVRNFRRNYATSPSAAKTLDELRLKPPDIVQQILNTRDYKPVALDTLIKTGVVIPTEGNKYYLSEEQLSVSVVCKKANIPPSGSTYK